ncbi:50S ribosomal protein L10 [Flaviaesturariibacter flavus]|uniref:50S ribosomal protein L10 n=1 Tax=Flaviaesturariibacter flavus TaxID=2502780 RepID=A0A4R1BJW8_9BACT|nr:50S ribosomal protein L10 [Flaviaesturariibacter flavus]TCJ17613.1 50S ribosomal protein L10 [Flaviaesturariibacter flavus]
MTKEQKNEVIAALKEKFSQYDNFYVTNTESLSVEQVSSLRRACFNKKVEMKVAKNTLIRKALEGLDEQRYSGMFESLNNVTALLFSENPKEPALIISSFRDAAKGEKPELKAAFINGDIYTGDNNLKTLTKIKTKNELIGEVIGLLQSPASRVLAALQNFHETGGVIRKPGEEAAAPAAEAAAPAAEAPAAPEASAGAPAAEGETPAAE